GVLVVEAPRHLGPEDCAVKNLACSLENHTNLKEFPWVVLVDNAEFTSANSRNFLWTVFTKTNPANDIDGVKPKIEHKHWSCEGPVLIDARSKPHHAPALEEPPEITQKVNELASKGGPLHGVI
ncbi:MAG: 3-octaprenyl-4-hydroxybenzoate carboxy-lyase, partial [Planctomycetia bacterium]